MSLSPRGPRRVQRCSGGAWADFQLFVSTLPHHTHSPAPVPAVILRDLPRAFCLYPWRTFSVLYDFTSHSAGKESNTFCSGAAAHRLARTGPLGRAPPARIKRISSSLHGVRFPIRLYLLCRVYRLRLTWDVDLSLEHRTCFGTVGCFTCLRRGQRTSPVVAHLGAAPTCVCARRQLCQS